MRSHRLSEPCIIIVGMHRSGTSVLTGCLRALGVSLGDSLIPENIFNELGHFENNDIWVAHERLYHNLGYSWDMVGDLPAGWLDGEAATQAAKSLTDIVERQFLGKGPWAVKDPRICRLLPLWLRVLEAKDISPVFVLMTRHPDEVAASLTKRDGLDLTTGRLLWLAHYRDALRSLADQRYAVITYDQLLADPLSTLHNLCAYFGLDLPLTAASAQIMDLVRPGLRHHYPRIEPDGAQNPYVWLYATLQQRQLTSRALQDGAAKERQAPAPITDVDALTPVHPFALETLGKEHSSTHGAAIMSDILSALGRYEQRENDDRLRRERAFLATTGAALFLQVYFPQPTSGESTYREESSRRFLLIPDQWNEISLDVAAPETLKTSRLRLDPLNQQGQVTFSNLRLINAATEAVLWEASTVQDFQACARNEQALLLPDAPEPCLLCMGSDPMLYLPSLPELPDVPIRLSVWVKPSRDTLTVKSSLEAVTRERDTTATRLRQAEDDLERERTAFAQEKDDLTGRLADAQAALEASRLETAEEQRSGSSVRETLNQALADFAATQKALEDQLETLHKQLATESCRADTAESGLETLRAQTQGLTSHLEAAQAEIQAQTARADTAEFGLEALHVQVQALDGHLDASQAEIQAQTARADTAESGLKALRVQVQALTGRLEAFQAEIQAQTARADTAESDLEALRTQAQGLTDHLEAAQAEIQAQTAQADTARARSLTLSERLDVAQTQIQDLTERLETAHAAVQDRIREIDAIRAAQTDARNQQELVASEALAASLQEARTEREQLQDEMRDLLALRQRQDNALEAAREATRAQTRRAEAAEAALETARETARADSAGQGRQLQELRDQLDMENRKFEAVRQDAAREQQNLRQSEALVEILRARLLSLMGQLQDVEHGREHLIDLVREKAAALLLRIGSTKLQLALQFYRDFESSSRKMARAKKEFKEFQASQIARIEQAGALDTAYYDAHNPDVGAEHFPPVEHYVRHGWREDRAPKADFDNALYLLDHPDLIDSGLCPLAHALDAPETDRKQTATLSAAIELRPAPGAFEAALVRQSGLFDAAYYAGTHAYLAGSSPDALLRHYLAHGWKEGSRPNGWLDLSRSPLGRSGSNRLCPLVRMALLETGPKTKALASPSEPLALAAATAPSGPAPESVPKTQAPPESDYDRAMRLIVEQRLFDAEFYRQQYEDLHALAEPRALLRHYMEYGWKEGRRASPEFDTAYYMAKYPFVAQSGINPLVHYALYGRPEGFSGAMRTDDPAPLLAALRPAAPAGAGAWTPPGIIVPVYVRDEAGLGLLDRLLASLDAGTPEPCRFVILDDASPHPGVGERLDAFRDAHPGCVAERNPQNLGFVRTVNKAFTLASGDVVIVNMDVEVPQGWLTRIMAPLRRTDIRVASVTPMTNSGTIASFPVFCQDNAGLPLDMDLAAVDAVFARYDPSATIEIPTGVGFCMAMSRAALKEVGDFDAVSFGQGYGEENDWCRRALHQGFVNLLLPGCFVWHKHGGSFAPDQKQALCRANSARLSEKHPDYNREVARFVERDPGNVFRFHAAVHLAVAHARQPVFLIVDHGLGGGASVYSEARLEQERDRRPCLLLYRDQQAGVYAMELFYRQLAGKVRFSVEARLFDFLLALPVGEFLFNNFATWPDILGTLERFSDLADRLNARTQFLFHDYYSLCPKGFLVNEAGVFCEVEANPEACDRCSSAAGLSEVGLSAWREGWLRFLERMDTLRCFSASSLPLVQARFGPTVASRLVVEPHAFSLESRKPVIIASQAFTVGVVGHIMPHKGAGVVKELVATMDRRGLGRVRIIGTYGGEPIDSDRFEVTGAYDGHDALVAEVERGGTAVYLFPSACPETFSFVVSELMAMDLYVTCLDIGAPAERLRHYAKGRVLPLHATPEALFDALLETWNRSAGQEPDCVRLTRATDPAALMATLPAAGRPLRVLMSSGLHDSASRLYRLNNQAEQLECNGWPTRIVTSDELAAVSPDDFDVLYLHRMPWGGPVSLLVEAAARQRKPVVADLDDLLFSSALDSQQFYFLKDASADCRRAYRRVANGVETLLRASHALVASTPAIAEAGMALGKPAFVQRNSLSRDQLDLARRVREHTPFPQEPVMIFAAGSNTHDQDLALIEPVLARIFDEIPAARLIMLGHLCQESGLLRNFASRVERVAYLHDAEAYFGRMAQGTVALAPLYMINTFSEAKSAVKFLEFGALGVPLIASPSGEYSRHIRHGESGWLVRDAREWHEALRTALTPGTAAAAGAAAREDVLAWCDVQTNADRLCGFLSGLAARVAAGEGFGPA